jgi:Asp-tRNA(Asn)/Glu-tRNA(Gln) amidotransferase A subunit family amidase
MTPRGSVRHMGVYGPLARSIADLRLCFSLLAGPDGRQPEVPLLPVAAESPLPPGGRGATRRGGIIGPTHL